MHGRAQDLDSWGSRGFQEPWKSMLTLERWARISLAKGESISERKSSPAKVLRKEAA